MKVRLVEYYVRNITTSFQFFVGVHWFIVVSYSLLYAGRCRNARKRVHSAEVGILLSKDNDATKFRTQQNLDQGRRSIVDTKTVLIRKQRLRLCLPHDQHLGLDSRTTVARAIGIEGVVGRAPIVIENFKSEL